MNQPASSRRTSLLIQKTCLSVLIAMTLGTSAHAQQQANVIQYQISAGDLVHVVNEISRNSGVQIVYDIEVLRGKKAGEIRGSLTLKEALDRALSGSGLRWTQVNEKTVSIQKTSAPKGSNEQKSARDLRKQVGKGSEVEDLEQVVVVGSRLGTSPVESAMPIKVITRDDLDRSGAGNVAQALSYLSEVSVSNSGDINIGGSAVFGDGGNVNSTTVQMRGLPRGTTLVLVNGRRAGESSSFTFSGQFDLSSVPLALVERIEVLPAGSSAIYGGDALAGVVNIVLRQDASGVDVRLRRMQSEGYRTEDASVLIGRSWSKGDVTFSATWKRNDSLFSSERDLTADQDYRRFGSTDRRPVGGGYPATIYSLVGCSKLPCTVPISSRGNLPGLSSPIAVVPLGQDGQDLKPSDFLATQGGALRQNSKRHLFSAEKTLGASLRGTVHLSEQLDVFTEWNYTKRDVPAYQVPLIFDNGINGAPRATVPGDHPFNPFDVPVAIAVRINETGIYTDYGQTYLRGLLGFKGEAGRFDWEVSAWRSRDKSVSSGGTFFDNNAIITAMASKDPGTTINPFVSDGSAPASREFLLSLMAATRQESQSTTSAATGFIKGPVWELPAGDLVALAGSERVEHTLSIQSNASGVLVPSIKGSVSSNALFAEFRAPLLSGPKDGSLERLAVTGAMRSEWGSRYESSAQTYATGVEFRPLEALMLRATYSTAFKPILAYSAVQDPRQRTASVVDPRANGQFYAVQTITTGGVPPKLEPEESWTKTLGATYRPSQDLTLSMTLWDTKFEDRISFISLQSLVDNEDLYPGRVTRSPTTGLIESVDARQVNIAMIRTTGVDLGAEWSLYYRGGSVQPSISATYVNRYEEQLTNQSPVESWLATLNRSGGWAPKWKIVPRVSWEHGSWLRVSTAGRYVSSYRDTVAYSTGPLAGKFGTLGNFWLLDANVELSLAKLFSPNSFLSGARLSIGSSNLLNKLPDYCVACGVSGYDASQYDIMGRTIYAELRLGL